MQLKKPDKLAIAAEEARQAAIAAEEARQAAIAAEEARQVAIAAIAAEETLLNDNNSFNINEKINNFISKLSTFQKILITLFVVISLYFFLLYDKSQLKRIPSLMKNTKIIK